MLANYSVPHQGKGGGSAALFRLDGYRGLVCPLLLLLLPVDLDLGLDPDLGPDHHWILRCRPVRNEEAKNKKKKKSPRK